MLTGREYSTVRRALALLGRVEAMLQMSLSDEARADLGGELFPPAPEPTALTVFTQTLRRRLHEITNEREAGP